MTLGCKELENQSLWKIFNSIISYFIGINIYSADLVSSK